MNWNGFFDAIYRTYDRRFPYLATSVSALKRLVWAEDSTALTCLGEESERRARLGYEPRLG